MHYSTHLNKSQNTSPNFHCTRNKSGSLTSCPERMISTFCQEGSVESFLLTKNSRCCCSRHMNSVPGVMQLESNLSSQETQHDACSMAWTHTGISNVPDTCMYRHSAAAKAQHNYMHTVIFLLRATCCMRQETMRYTPSYTVQFQHTTLLHCSLIPRPRPPLRNTREAGRGLSWYALCRS